MNLLLNIIKCTIALAIVGGIFISNGCFDFDFCEPFDEYECGPIDSPYYITINPVAKVIYANTGAALSDSTVYFYIKDECNDRNLFNGFSPPWIGFKTDSSGCNTPEIYHEIRIYYTAVILTVTFTKHEYENGNYTYLSFPYSFYEHELRKYAGDTFTLEHVFLVEE
jgi:hypothetical protein